MLFERSDEFGHNNRGERGLLASSLQCLLDNVRRCRVEGFATPDDFTPLPDDRQALFEAIAQAIADRGYPLTHFDENTRRGYGLTVMKLYGAAFPDGAIYVRKSLSSSNKILIVLHEYAHHIFDLQAGLEPRLGEPRAEAFSYVVAAGFGLVDPDCAAQIASWGSSTEITVENQANDILEAAADLVISVQDKLSLLAQSGGGERNCLADSEVS